MPIATYEALAFAAVASTAAELLAEEEEKRGARAEPKKIPFF